MGADVVDLEPGGGGPKGIGSLLQSGSAGGVAFQGRYVGPEPPDGAGPKQLQSQGHVMAHRDEAEAKGGGEMLISSADGGNRGGGL